MEFVWAFFIAMMMFFLGAFCGEEDYRREIQMNWCQEVHHSDLRKGLCIKDGVVMEFPQWLK